jgi:hypothetical protein
MTPNITAPRPTSLKLPLYSVRSAVEQMESMDPGGRSNLSFPLHRPDLTTGARAYEGNTGQADSTCEGYDFRAVGIRSFFI